MAARVGAPAATPWVLADTNAWIDFARDRNDLLRSLVESGRIVAHEAVIGELTLGCGPRIARLADRVAGLPVVQGPPIQEIRSFLRAARVPCNGLGWCDACLLAACVLSGGAVSLLTGDRQLRQFAVRMGVAYG